MGGLRVKKVTQSIPTAPPPPMEWVPSWDVDMGVFNCVDNTAMAVCPDMPGHGGPVLVTATAADLDLQVWSVAPHGLERAWRVRSPLPHGNCKTNMAFTKDHARCRDLFPALLVADERFQLVHVLDITAAPGERVVTTFHVGVNVYWFALATSPSEPLVAISGVGDRVVHMFRRTGPITWVHEREVHVMGVRRAMPALRFSWDGTAICYGGFKFEVPSLYRIKDGKLVGRLRCEVECTDLEPWPDGRWVVGCAGRGVWAREVPVTEVAALAIRGAGAVTEAYRTLAEEQPLDHGFFRHCCCLGVAHVPSLGVLVWEQRRGLQLFATRADLAAWGLVATVRGAWMAAVARVVLARARTVAAAATRAQPWKRRK